MSGKADSVNVARAKRDAAAEQRAAAEAEAARRAETAAREAELRLRGSPSAVVGPRLRGALLATRQAAQRIAASADGADPILTHEVTGLRRPATAIRAQEERDRAASAGESNAAARILQAV
jgi:hypothetical protein